MSVIALISRLACIQYLLWTLSSEVNNSPWSEHGCYIWCAKTTPGNSPEASSRPRVLSCCPGRRASRRWQGSGDPRRGGHSAGTASSGWGSAAPQRPWRRWTSCSLEQSSGQWENPRNKRQTPFHSCTTLTQPTMVDIYEKAGTQWASHTDQKKRKKKKAHWLLRLRTNCAFGLQAPSSTSCEGRLSLSEGIITLGWTFHGHLFAYYSVISFGNR